MPEAISVQPATTLRLNLRPVMELTDERLYLLCQANRELRFERTAQGELLLMAPTAGETGRRNAKLTQHLANWADMDGSGLVFDSSTGFVLPNGAMRSPDAAWLRRSRWESLRPDQKQTFIPLCPDFVIELRSGTDSLQALQDKLQEYHPKRRAAGLAHRSAHTDGCTSTVPACQSSAWRRSNSISGDPELPGFVLDLSQVWD